MVNKKIVVIAGLSLLLAGVLTQGSPQSAEQQPASSDSVPGMSLIPAGEFWMGRVHMFMFDELSWVARARLDDQPARPVFLDAFYMDKYEVQTTEYAKFVEATGHAAPWHWREGKIKPGQEQWPVYNVSWDDSAAYCTWAGKRLPTEAEWEKAARGGLERKLYPWGDQLEPEVKGEAAAAEKTAKKKTMTMARYGFPNGPTRVGTFPPNGYGLYDMIGNVWEWVADWYGQDYYPIAPSKNPRGPETGKYRVLRGAGWDTTEDVDSGQRSLLGSHYRNYGLGDQMSNVVGFRCAKDAPQKDTPQKP